MNKDQAAHARKVLSHALDSGGDIDATNLGLKIGRGKDYVRDFLDERKSSLGAAEIASIEIVLGLKPGALLGTGRWGDFTPATARAAPEATDLALGAKDVPIQGTSVGGTSGEFYLNGETVDYARRLPGISKNKNVFGVYIEGESMSPRFEPGELVYASPGRAPTAGDFVIVELAPTAGERAGPAYIKRLKRRAGNKLVCEQFNPAGEVEYDQREVKAIYRIIPLAELAGF